MELRTIGSEGTEDSPFVYPNHELAAYSGIRGHARRLAACVHRFRRTIRR
jgi:hypothetical protein